MKTLFPDFASLLSHIVIHSYRNAGLTPHREQWRISKAIDNVPRVIYVAWLLVISLCLRGCRCVDYV